MTIELEPVEPEGESEVLTLWDKRMVAAIRTATGARRGVLLLRIAAGLVVAFDAIGSWLVVYGDRSTGSDTVFAVAAESRDQLKLGQFLGSLASGVAYSGVLLALSFLLAVYAARLDMDIVLADEQEVERMNRADG